MLWVLTSLRWTGLAAPSTLFIKWLTKIDGQRGHKTGLNKRFYALTPAIWNCCLMNIADGVTNPVRQRSKHIITTSFPRRRESKSDPHLDPQLHGDDEEYAAMGEIMLSFRAKQKQLDAKSHARSACPHRAA